MKPVSSQVNRFNVAAKKKLLDDCGIWRYHVDKGKRERYYSLGALYILLELPNKAIIVCLHLLFGI
jgi:hypothetical protein